MTQIERRVAHCHRREPRARRGDRRLLASRGYDLVIGARDRRVLSTTSRMRFRRLGGTGRAVPGDVTDPGVRARGWSAAARQLGGLHVLVNNASELGRHRPARRLDLARLERVLQVNLVAPVALMQLALPLLRRARGLVVNVSSDAARGAIPDGADTARARRRWI